MTTNDAKRPHSRRTSALALLGFVAVAVAQVSNMILARANADVVPPFSIAFFRWLIIAAGLAPFAFKELKDQYRQIVACRWLIIAAGFLGMFLCGAPIYIAGGRTTAINIALIIAMSPIIVLLLSWIMGLEKIRQIQLVGMSMALVGALVTISRGDATALITVSGLQGDLFVLVAMIGWSGYTLLQTRGNLTLSFLSRVCIFSAVGAMLSLPFAIAEACAAPPRVFNMHAAAIYVFAGTVPGILAYSGFAYLGAKFGSVRTSLVLYIGPFASTLLSFLILGEPPRLIHVLGGALILGGVWVSLRK